ncbi:hypothetical protein Zmor_014826 [Zophobas morio]|uniref:Uncharacterized protein n=1 Tax=Zophobas morio TaxID=2755281 RepID=A0AA38IKB6_9CUCU|nr:hypothetical protein Zmor_014826 [Zophobas morio]
MLKWLISMYGRSFGNPMTRSVFTVRNFLNVDYPIIVHLLRLTNVCGKTARLLQKLRIGVSDEQSVFYMRRQKFWTSLKKNRIGVRRLSYRVGISPFVVWRTLYDQGLYPYHVQRVHTLKPEDLPRRMRFCEWLLERNGADLHL